MAQVKSKADVVPARLRMLAKRLEDCEFHPVMIPQQFGKLAQKKRAAISGDPLRSGAGGTGPLDFVHQRREARPPP